MLEQYLDEYLKHRPLPAHHLCTLKALQHCRTSRLGGHVDACDECGHVQISYNSCRNRHCPKCQSQERQRWISARQQDLLPVSYFHVVFTLPDSLNGLCLSYPRQLYDLLFAAAWSTLESFARDKKHLGAKAAMVAILHTWGQTLSLHPHLHCIVPGGGITPAGHWIKAPGKGKFLFPVKAMSKVFRARFVAGLREWLPAQGLSLEGQLAKKLFAHPWVVFAKQPFPGPEAVVEYLGRYTHKIALSNHRLLESIDGKVTFSYKDYRHQGEKKQMSLSALEFIRRFCLHILPKGFVRIRHFGFLSAKAKKQDLEKLRLHLNASARPECLAGSLPAGSVTEPVAAAFGPLGQAGYGRQCPCCQKGTLKEIFRFEACRSPPDEQYLMAIALHQLSLQRKTA